MNNVRCINITRKIRNYMRLNIDNYIPICVKYTRILLNGIHSVYIVYIVHHTDNMYVESMDIGYFVREGHALEAQPHRYKELAHASC